MLSIVYLGTLVLSDIGYNDCCTYMYKHNIHMYTYSLKHGYNTLVDYNTIHHNKCDG